MGVVASAVAGVVAGAASAVAPLVGVEVAAAPLPLTNAELPLSAAPTVLIRGALTEAKAVVGTAPRPPPPPQAESISEAISEAIRHSADMVEWLDGRVVVGMPRFYVAGVVGDA